MLMSGNVLLYLNQGGFVSLFVCSYSIETDSWNRPSFPLHILCKKANHEQISRTVGRAFLILGSLLAPSDFHIFYFLFALFFLIKPMLGSCIVMYLYGTCSKPFFWIKDSLGRK